MAAIVAIVNQRQHAKMTDFTNTNHRPSYRKMKNSDSVSGERTVPSLFQIAAFFEDFFPSRFRQSADAVAHMPIAEYMLNPERLMSLLRSGKSERREQQQPRPQQARPAEAQAAAGEQASSKRLRNPLKKNPSPTPSPAPGMPPNRSEKPEGADGTSSRQQREIEFTLKSPAASSVKLAGDFTDWENHALEMMHSNEGVWHTVVPLAPGSYSYRFIVDGQWCDDPARDHIPNPFGTENAVIHVT